MIRPSWVFRPMAGTTSPMSLKHQEDGHDGEQLREHLEQQQHQQTDRGGR